MSSFNSFHHFLFFNEFPWFRELFFFRCKIDMEPKAKKIPRFLVKILAEIYVLHCTNFHFMMAMKYSLNVKTHFIAKSGDSALID